MGLHDQDKTNSNRIQPQVNSPDNVANRQSHNTYGNTYRNADGEVTQRMIFKNGLILTYDADNNCSSVFGYLPEISDIPVYIVAREGWDVFVNIFGIDPPVV